MLQVEPAHDSDLETIVALLGEGGLPLDGLLEVPTAAFVARDGDRVVGAVALERHGEDGLLRSLIVHPGQRGKGIGTALVNSAEREASRLGLGAIYLLTETATTFFAGRGYRQVDRSGAPRTVMESVEWSVACADTATAMMKKVDRVPSRVARPAAS
ncbi:MAG TPA: arsenic resistance N-acetyltransferase ArsN2 [Acidimicrobiia bacterium]|nr:arsenic resistance N-acetyltransferase ArsN2 [Acidimicrobiia bacterium]